MIGRLVFAMDADIVVFEACTEFLYLIQILFGLKIVKVQWSARECIYVACNFIKN
jgi:hypothetical protein